MLIKKVYEAALPYLEGRTIRDAVVGLSLVAVQLDNGNVGLSYMLREGLPAGCSAFPYAQGVIDMDAKKAAQWAIAGAEDAQRALGMAVLTAASRSQQLVDVENSGQTFGIETRAADTVGMIGYIQPVARELEKSSKKVYIFDKGISERGGSKGEICSMEEQAKLLPCCDIVILSGTTMINNTIEELLGMCKNAREIVMVGSSTPMFPEGFKGSGVSTLAGSWWNGECKEEIFKSISLACGISYLHKYMIKKAVRV